MTIAAILSSKGGEVVTITAERSVADAVKLLATRRIGAVLVMDGDAPIGIFSERDVIYFMESVGAAVLDKTVGEVMTAPAVTVAPGDSVLGALSLMTRRRIRHLPVMAEGRVAGVVSIGDLVKYRIDRIESEASAMRDYIQSA